MFPQGVQYAPPQQGQVPAGYSQNVPVSGHPMMWLAGSNPGTMWVFGVLWLITWVLLIVVLTALARWLWKKGDKVH